ncbi:MAG: hypothetical protein JWP48_1558 [Actinoallomurus sp.]|jgi:hypothetical protein|nr:hypothetical protein [Actinoallomurus sp.]
MPDDMVVKDSDDRSERMISDPGRYFAEARERAEREVRREVEGGKDTRGHERGE